MSPLILFFLLHSPSKRWIRCRRLSDCVCDHVPKGLFEERERLERAFEDDRERASQIVCDFQSLTDDLKELEVLLRRVALVEFGQVLSLSL